MTGILLVSKGPLAKGMYESVKEEYFKDPQQFDYLIYSDSYRKDLMKKINELNDGHGVIILSDMMGEAPSNYASLLLDKGVHMVSGMNLSIKELYKMLPYVVTIIVLVISSNNPYNCP